MPRAHVDAMEPDFVVPSLSGFRFSPKSGRRIQPGDPQTSGPFFSKPPVDVVEALDRVVPMSPLEGFV